MFKPAAQRQKLALIFSTRKLLVLGVQCHLVTWSTSLQLSDICFMLCWQPSLIELSALQLWEIVFRCFSFGWFAQFSKQFVKIADFLHFSKWPFRQFFPSPVFTQLWANEKRLTAEFYRYLLKIAGLHIFGISDESTETTKSYINFNDELRWLWNSVYNPNGAKYVRKCWLENESKPILIFWFFRIPLLISKDQKENIICTMNDVRGDFLGSPHGTTPAALFGCQDIRKSPKKMETRLNMVIDVDYIIWCCIDVDVKASILTYKQNSLDKVRKYFMTTFHKSVEYMILFRSHWLL